ncbi:inactive polypeptide N-acetylgalactosaminyltransferase-like protein 5 [Amphiura filiformis]|uniref:inactive polypeptide N-acetylgalactosaminyltransferase-like protein 5 n=1 Tax=Amphiura filiformis TaxID=82378 RepID=UPI003B220D65
MATVRLFFTFLMFGIAWFTMIAVIYFVYHESKLPAAVESKRAIMEIGVRESLTGDFEDISKDDTSKDAKPRGANKEIYSGDEDEDMLELDDTITRYGPGENGQPVRLYGEKEEEGKAKWGLHNYNVVVSGIISLQRTLKDVRDERCMGLSYQRYDLPTASVIIAFHNEAWTVLIRMVYSIYNRTPEDLLQEIILVDDASDEEELCNKLEHIPRKVRSKVRQVHTTRRLGVVKAQMEGAKVAIGDVVVFMDSKCEVHRQWLEPLLGLIHHDQSVLVSPVIDRIHPDTFEYQSSPLSFGIFTWDLGFKWSPLSKADLAERRQKAKPYRSPAVSSSVFAISRQYLSNLGGLDVGMEDLKASQSAAMEMSMKVWMCGGTVRVAPCSRVGQIMTAPPKSALVDLDETAERRNRVRIAEAWMDEYAKHFYTVLPLAANSFYGNISSQLQLRNRLQCHHFNWYLNNVFPSLLATSHDRLIAWGQCSNKGSSLCLDTLSADEGKPLGIAKCQSTSNTQGVDTCIVILEYQQKD